jgi:hypothetical protein
MEVVAATFWRASESRQVHSLSGARPFGRAPFLCTLSVLTEPLGCRPRNPPIPQQRA